jgi:hypothetical protein
MAHRLSNMRASSYGGTIRQSFHGSARRRMAAVALAIRLYELDHGSLPEQLEQLVPGYLAAIPRDPFAEDSGRIKYRPTASLPVLYSIGPPPDRGAKRVEITFPLRAKSAATAASPARTRPVNP